MEPAPEEVLPGHRRVRVYFDAWLAGPAKADVCRKASAHIDQWRPLPVREGASVGLGGSVAGAEFAAEAFAHGGAGLVEAGDFHLFAVVVVFLRDRVQGGDG